MVLSFPKHINTMETMILKKIRSPKELVRQSRIVYGLREDYLKIQSSFLV
jgi:hypothetical protein